MSYEFEVPESVDQVEVGQEEVLEQSNDEVEEIDVAALQAELEKTRQELKLTSQQYKSLQGQHRSVAEQGNQISYLKAQIDDLRLASANSKKEEPEQPLIPAELKEFLGDQAHHFEGIARQARAADQRAAALEAELVSLRQQTAAAPFKFLEATDTVMTSQGYAEYLKKTTDELGLSLYDRISTLGERDSNKAMAAMMKAKEAYIKTIQPKPAIPSPSVTPNLQPVAAMPTASKTAFKENELRAEYERLVRGNKASDRDRRVAIALKFAQQGVSL